MILGIIGAAVVITLIAVPTAIFLNEEEDVGDPRKTYTLDDYFNSTIRSKSYSMRWISDTEYLRKTREGAVTIYSVDTETTTDFLSSKPFDETEATDYLVSADRNYVCFESNYTKQWRHSFSASYSMFYMGNNSFVESHIPEMVQNFAWAPIENKLAFVWNYNVYVKPNATAEAIQVTTNGKENEILNGIPDWVYEEEMFSSKNAMWWSPNGRFLAYAEFDDRLVPTIEYSWYGSEQYPKTVIIPYPKAGASNPKVKLFTVDTTNASNTIEVVVPSSVGARDHYLSTVTWVTDERIAVQWQKRTQNYVLLQIYDFDGSRWNEKTSHVEELQHGWVGRFSPNSPVFAEDKISFYKVMSDSNGYKHIHYVNAKAEVTPITTGKWEVISISKLTKDAIYYVSNEYLLRPGQRNVYKISIGSSGHSAPQCLTCKMQEDRCQYNSAYFSENASFYRMDCYGPGLPLFILFDNRGNPKEIQVLENNKDLEHILSGIQMPTVRRDNITLNGLDLWYQMTLPPHFDKSKKYPLLIDVYAGPCSQKVNYAFRLNWATYLASTENVIVASFDGRGSGFQGDRIMHAIYRQLGSFEVEDQISAAKKFIDMGFIDKDRIAIWGWSYGGYVTSMALGAGSGVFKCGIAVAPVSKWEYYDSIYTERYMNKPSDNLESYKNSTVTRRARNFKSVEYLLVHGTADDNVHFQQAAQISKALVEAKVDFEAMWYTDKDHGLEGSAHYHVYTHMSHFLQKCFTKK